MITSIIDRLLTWWLHTGRYRWSRWRRKLFEAKYRGRSLPEANSLAEIEACLDKVTWTMDGPLHLFDAISYPQTVWEQKKDDCDGFAVLAAELLRRWQPDSEPVLLTAMLRPLRKSHSVCAFKSTAGGFWFFDNDSLRQGDFKTYAEIITLVAGDNILVCWDVVAHDSLRTIEFHRA